jgi:2-polyprenyl-3-methyl-5-hydroxy-6-metoxy-1,4-benzoquinol methylase
MENNSNNKCIVCGSTNNKLFLNCTDHFVTQESFKIHKCSDCGFAFTADAPTPDKIGRYYKSEDYISHSNINKGLVNKLYHIVRNYMLGKKCRMIKGLTGGRELLDIGCGTGHFLNYMKGKGFTCEGVEIAESARDFAINNFGLTVNSPDVFLNEASAEKFDVITLWHVLEHLCNPEEYVSSIYKSLKKDGFLIIALPNCSSLDAKYYKQYWAAYDTPRHLWHFTPADLEKFLNRSDFSLKKIKRLPFDAYYNSMMSAKYAGKKCALLDGVFTGLRSNCISLFCVGKTSSVIYILKKTI